MAVPAILSSFFKHPDMFVQPVTFDSVVAFLTGYNLACAGGVLVGFREWSIVKLDDGNNLAWPELFLRLTLPKTKWLRSRDFTKADQKHLIEELSETLEAFWKERDEIDGLQSIFVRHADWLKTQDWYREKKVI